MVTPQKLPISERPCLGILEKEAARPRFAINNWQQTARMGGGGPPLPKRYHLLQLFGGGRPVKRSRNQRATSFETRLPIDT